LTFFFATDIIKIMNTITIPKNLIKTKSEDLDKRVEEALKEHKKEKTEKLESFLEKEYSNLHK